MTESLMQKRKKAAEERARKKAERAAAPTSRRLEQLIEKIDAELKNIIIEAAKRNKKITENYDQAGGAQVYKRFLAACDQDGDGVMDTSELLSEMVDFCGGVDNRKLDAAMKARDETQEAWKYAHERVVLGRRRFERKGLAQYVEDPALLEAAADLTEERKQELQAEIEAFKAQEAELVTLTRSRDMASDQAEAAELRQNVDERKEEERAAKDAALISAGGATAKKPLGPPKKEVRRRGVEDEVDDEEEDEEVDDGLEPIELLEARLQRLEAQQELRYAEMEVTRLKGEIRACKGEIRSLEVFISALLSRETPTAGGGRRKRKGDAEREAALKALEKTLEGLESAKALKIRHQGCRGSMLTNAERREAYHTRLQTEPAAGSRGDLDAARAEELQEVEQTEKKLQWELMDIKTQWESLPKQWGVDFSVLDSVVRKVDTVMTNRYRDLRSMFIEFQADDSGECTGEKLQVGFFSRFGISLGDHEIYLLMLAASPAKPNRASLQDISVMMRQWKEETRRIGMVMRSALPGEGLQPWVKICLEATGGLREMAIKLRHKGLTAEADAVLDLWENDLIDDNSMLLQKVHRATKIAEKLEELERHHDAEVLVRCSQKLQMAAEAKQSAQAEHRVLFDAKKEGTEMMHTLKRYVRLEHAKVLSGALEGILKPDAPLDTKAQTVSRLGFRIKAEAKKTKGHDFTAVVEGLESLSHEIERARVMRHHARIKIAVVGINFQMQPLIEAVRAVKPKRNKDKEIIWTTNKDAEELEFIMEDAADGDIDFFATIDRLTGVRDSLRGKRLFERAWEVEAIRLEIFELQKPLDNMVDAFKRAEAERIRVMEQTNQLVMIQSVLSRLFATMQSIYFRQWFNNMSSDNLSNVQHQMWEVLHGSHQTIRLYQRRLVLETQRTGLGIVNAVLRVWLQQEALRAIAAWSEATALEYYCQEVNHEDEDRFHRKEALLKEEAATEAAFNPQVEKKVVPWKPPKPWEPSDEWSNFTHIFPDRPNLEELGQAQWQLADHPDKLPFGSAGGWMGHSKRKHPREGCSCAACRSPEVFTSKEHPSVRPPKTLGVVYPDLASTALSQGVMHPSKAGSRKVAQKRRYSMRGVHSLMGPLAPAEIPRTQTAPGQTRSTRYVPRTESLTPYQLLSPVGSPPSHANASPPTPERSTVKPRIVHCRTPPPPISTQEWRPYTPETPPRSPSAAAFHTPLTSPGSHSGDISPARSVSTPPGHKPSPLVKSKLDIDLTRVSAKEKKAKRHAVAAIEWRRREAAPSTSPSPTVDRSPLSPQALYKPVYIHKKPIDASRSPSEALSPSSQLVRNPKIAPESVAEAYRAVGAELQISRTSPERGREGALSRQKQPQQT